jgi:hypothetical protein
MNGIRGTRQRDDLKKGLKKTGAQVMQYSVLKSALSQY